MVTKYKYLDVESRKEFIKAKTTTETLANKYLLTTAATATTSLDNLCFDSTSASQLLLL